MEQNFKEIMDLSLGEIVAKNYKSALIFENYGLDFCCNGHISLKNACLEKSLDTKEILSLLENLNEDNPEQTDFNDLSLDKLTEYIFEKHHKYLYEQAFPSISGKLKKLLKVHGQKHPELNDISQKFEMLAEELISHMMKEEKILFPYINSLALSINNNAAFITVKNPIRVMESEHNHAGEELRNLRELTNNYNPPADGCNTYRAAFRELKEFEADLHKHIHLENNILHPQAIKLESELFLRNEVKR